MFYHSITMLYCGFILCIFSFLQLHHALPIATVNTMTMPVALYSPGDIATYLSTYLSKFWKFRCKSSSSL